MRWSSASLTRVRMDWLLPGIPPTGKRVEVPFVGIIRFAGDKIVHEHLYWDQASLLVQIGLLVPVRGAEIAAQVLSPAQPMNALIPRGGVREASRDAGTRGNGGASSSAA